MACGKSAQDAHHIIERRLFPDGGYYLDNGVSVCGDCHLRAESTTLGCTELREMAGITTVVLPPHLYRDQEYDKWGNPVLPNGTRLRGELFWDSSVHKVLRPVWPLFTSHVKYPRTYHLPWSPGVGKDDRIIDSADLDAFRGRDVVVTVKMDGENTTMYQDYIHARSLEYSPHPSRDRVKALHAQLAHNIPPEWRVCGENLFAKHSIHYNNLSHFFQVFSVWDEMNVCLDWEETKVYSELLGLVTVPVLYQGPWDEKLIRGIYQDNYAGDECEGYVVRPSGEFHYAQFRRVVGKYVRANHVHTHAFWMQQTIVENKFG